MKIKLLAAILIWFCVLGNAAYAQKENNIWYFGEFAGLDFNSGIPVALLNSAMNQHEGCASISNDNGDILFYTDGIKVWDRNHVQMPNGNGLAGGLSSTQSALIIPFIGNSTLYYIFTVAQYSPPPNNFSYSVVDMSLNSGNGDVTIKNSVIFFPVGEKLTAVKHANNTDIWVMVHGLSNNDFLAYLVTASGISAAPVTSSIGQIIPFTDMGYMKFSPDGSKIAFAELNPNYVDLFDFNTSTGVVTNEKYLTLPGSFSGPFAYGLEFSPNGNYLYCTQEAGQVIYQWDVTSNSAPIINSTLQIIGTTTAMEPEALQIGPDGKIYVALYQSSFLGVINYPDSGGVACNYVDNAVSLNGKTCKLGLPNFITSHFLPKGISSLQPPTSGLQIFPNPVTTEFQISNYQFQKGDEIRITDMLGKTLFTKTIAGKCSMFNVQCSMLASGMYFVTVSGEKGRMVKKFVKE